MSRSPSRRNRNRPLILNESGVATDCRESTDFIPLTETSDALKDAACTAGREIGDDFLRVDDRSCVHQLLGSHLDAITRPKLLGTLDSVSIDEGSVRAS